MTRPFERAGLLARFRAFAWVATLAIVAVAVEPSSRETGAVVGGVLLTGLVVLAVLFIPWQKLPEWTDALPPLAYVIAIALLRHGGGGVGSGLVTLYMVPIIWVALYGSRTQILILLAAVMAATVAPILLIGGERYPDEEWRRALITGAIGGLVGFAVRDLVMRVRGHVVTEASRAGALEVQETRLRAIHETAHDAIVTLLPSGEIIDVNPAALEMFRATERDQLLGRDLISTLAVEDEQEFLRQGMARLTVRQDETTSRRFKTALIRLDGEAFPAEVSVGVVAAAGTYVVHAFARDISDRVAAEAAARQHQEDLSGLLEVAREMSAPAEGAALRSTICRTALDLAQAAMAVLVEPLGDELVTTAAAGRFSTIDRVSRHSRATLTATVFQDGSPVFCGRLVDDPRVARLATSAGVNAGYWHPIRRKAEVVGVLTVLWDDEEDGLDPRTESLLTLLASQAEVALELGQLVGTLEALARTDGLTGVANRRTFDETLSAEIERAGRSGSPLSLIMLDLDHFKRYNDTRGHQAGDRLLVEVAGAWRRELRPSDILARYGGEEFTIVLPDCTAEAAMRVAGRLRDDVPGKETVSAGIATWTAGETAAELIARADAALYQAKAEGRDRAVAAA